MYYRSGTGERCCICARRTLRVHSPCCSGFRFCLKWRHGRHLERVWRHCIKSKIPPNVIPIRFETTEPYAYGPNFSRGGGGWAIIARKIFRQCPKNNAMLTCKTALPDSPHPIVADKHPGFRALLLGGRIEFRLLAFNKYFFHFWLLASARKI